MDGRRDVLNWLLGSWLAGVCGSVLYPISRYLVPPDIPEAAPQSVVAGKAADIPANTGKIIAFGTTPVIVVRTAAGELRAFSATCTHLSCTVQVPFRHRAHLVRVPQRPLRPDRPQRRRPTTASARSFRRRAQG